VWRVGLLSCLWGKKGGRWGLDGYRYFLKFRDCHCLVDSDHVPLCSGSRKTVKLLVGTDVERDVECCGTMEMSRFADTLRGEAV